MASSDPVFDLDIMAWRRRRALDAAQPGADFLAARAAHDLSERLAVVERRFATAAALHCTTAHAARAIADSGKAGHVLRVEADRSMLGTDAGMVAPLEALPFKLESLELAVSVLALQDANDVPGMLAQIRQALKPDGLFVGAMLGAGSLAELRECLIGAETELSGGASLRVHPFADVRDAGALLQRAGFALPVADLEPLTVRYDTLFGLMRDLRAMGATNALVKRSRRPARRALFLRAAEIYQQRFGDDDGRIRATFNVVWMSGWAPSTAQPKPLLPGTAKVSLADALKEPDRGEDGRGDTGRRGAGY